ncbi:MAG: class I SAM-dependent methyltransferase [Pseudomonadota bacterium]
MSTEQYDAYPYPARDPKDEAKRLITGAPSHPHEIDTHIYAGRRDWSQPFRALVAGGGTGDALVQLAQILTWAGAPYEIVYLDLSKSARGIAEARIKARGLKGVTFYTAPLQDAPRHGAFDYIDCCGVLHHLPDPGEGLRALEAALKPGGGIGFMVYAPYGRSGVYPVQEAFRALMPSLPPEERLKRAKKILTSLPANHPFRRNAMVGDHARDDAGLYDLLLHMQDRAFAVDEWLGELDHAGLALTSWMVPALYDLSTITDVPHKLPEREAMATAEKLRGTLTKHVGYAQRAGEVRAPMAQPSLALTPHLDVSRENLVKGIAAGKVFKVTSQGVTFRLKLPQSAAPILSRVNGRTTLAEIAGAVAVDAVRFQSLWANIHRAFLSVGMLRYSSLKPR